MPDGWTLPRLDDSNRAFFTSGRIELQVCSRCATVQHPPEEICHSCQSMEFGHREVNGRGTVYSYTVAHHAANPLLADRIPYAIVLVSLDELPGVRIVGNLLDVPPTEIEIGMPVGATWEEIELDGDLIRLPQWKQAQHRGSHGKQGS